MEWNIYVYEVKEWYSMPFYRCIFYFLFSWYIGIQYYMRGAHLTFDVGSRDIKEVMIGRKFQEVWFWLIVFGSCMYVIGGEKLNIDPAMMETIMN